MASLNALDMAFGSSVENQAKGISALWGFPGSLKARSEGEADVIGDAGID